MPSPYNDYVFTDMLAVEAKNFGVNAKLIRTDMATSSRNIEHGIYGRLKRYVYVSGAVPQGLIEIEDNTATHGYIDRYEYTARTKKNIRAAFIGLLHGNYYKRLSGYNGYRYSQVMNYAWPAVGESTVLLDSERLETCEYGFHICRLTDMWMWEGELVVQVEPCGNRLYHAEDKCVTDRARVIRDIGAITNETHFKTVKKIVECAIEDNTELVFRKEFSDIVGSMTTQSEARELQQEAEFLCDRAFQSQSAIDYRVSYIITLLPSLDASYTLMCNFPGTEAISLVERMKETSYAGYNLTVEEYIACIAYEAFTGEQAIPTRSD